MPLCIVFVAHWVGYLRLGACTTRARRAPCIAVSAVREYRSAHVQRGRRSWCSSYSSYSCSACIVSAKVERATRYTGGLRGVCGVTAPLVFVILLFRVRLLRSRGIILPRPAPAAPPRGRHPHSAPTPPPQPPGGPRRVALCRVDVPTSFVITASVLLLRSGPDCAAPRVGGKKWLKKEETRSERRGSATVHHAARPCPVS